MINSKYKGLSRWLNFVDSDWSDLIKIDLFLLKFIK